MLLGGFFNKAAFVKDRQAFQVISVIDVRVIRVQFDKAVCRGNAQYRVLFFKMGVGRFQLRLGRIAAIGVSRFQFAKVDDGFLVILIKHFGLAFSVDALCRPAFGVIEFSGVAEDSASIE